MIVEIIMDEGFDYFTIFFSYLSGAWSGMSTRQSVRRWLSKCADLLKGSSALTRNAHVKNNRVPCNLCSYKATSKKDVDKHVKSVHTKEKDHRCMHCDMRFSRRWYLVSHVRNMHSKVKDKEFQCNICDLKYALRDHPYMTSAKISGFLTPSPLVRIWD